MAELNLTSVDELISLRRGRRGLPAENTDGSREGQAVVRAIVIMLASSLQSYIGDVFYEASEEVFGEFDAEEEKRYRATWNRWGNPSAENTARLFRRLGIDDVFDGLSWQRQGTSALKKNLNQMNQIRNGIAHGGDLQLDGRPYSLTFAQAVRWRKVCWSLSERFVDHVNGRLN